MGSIRLGNLKDSSRMASALRAAPRGHSRTGKPNLRSSSLTGKASRRSKRRAGSLSRRSRGPDSSGLGNWGRMGHLGRRLELGRRVGRSSKDCRNTRSTAEVSTGLGSRMG